MSDDSVTGAQIENARTSVNSVSPQDSNHLLKLFPSRKALQRRHGILVPIAVLNERLHFGALAHPANDISRCLKRCLDA